MGRLPQARPAANLVAAAALLLLSHVTGVPGCKLITLPELAPLLSICCSAVTMFNCAASWHHAAFHTVTAVVGAGVLGLPHAFSFLGW